MPLSQSFQFLVDVSDFKKEVLLEANSDERARIFKGYGGYLAIINDYINDGSHSEVNIDSRTKSGILEYATFDLYSALDVVRQSKRGPQWEWESQRGAHSQKILMYGEGLRGTVLHDATDHARLFSVPHPEYVWRGGSSLGTCIALWPVSSFGRQTRTESVRDESTQQEVVLPLPLCPACSLQNERSNLFSAAEKEISKILMDNLINKFVVSAQYKAVVDLG